MGTEAPPGNLVSTTLLYDILYSDGTLTLSNASAFTNAQYHCLITDGTNFEMVESTGLSGSVLSINRAVELVNGVETAYGFAAGSTITIATSLQSVINLILQYSAISVVDQTLVSNAVTVAVTTQSSKLTNNSSAAATITLATSGAVDGQTLLVRFYDYANTAEALSWVNTENSTVSVPSMSNGSTTLPTTIGFIFNGATSNFRCMAVG
jgi:hypothetical protein